jgi:hypothetical protein
VSKFSACLGVVIAVAAAQGVCACRGIVAPGRTAGDTWGGAYSDPFGEAGGKPGESPKGGDAVTFSPSPKPGEPAEKAAAPAPEPGPHDRPGFVTREIDGRLWVFREGSKDLAAFLKAGEPAKSVTLVGEGPGGATVRGPDMDTVRAYVYSRPGFQVWVVDGRIWAFRVGSKEATAFAKQGEPAKSVTLVGEGPDGTTVRGPDMETVHAYVYWRPGFEVAAVDGRIWAFRAGSKEAAAFAKQGEPAKSVTLVGEGPGGATVRGPDMDTVKAYVYSRPGFEVWLVDGRIWVLRAGSKEAAAFAKQGEPAKSVTLVGEGPDGLSVRAPDLATAEAYVAARNR